MEALNERKEKAEGVKEGRPESEAAMRTEK